MTTTHTMTKTTIHAASPETVWAFLTESDKLGIWFHEPEASLANGRPFTMMSKETEGKKICWGEVLEWDAPNKLVYSFAVHIAEPLSTQVEWQLEEISGGTKLTLIHTGLPATSEMMGLAMGLDAGWDKHIGQLREAISA